LVGSTLRRFFKKRLKFYIKGAMIKMNDPKVIIANEEEDIEFEQEGTEKSQEIVIINGKEI